MYSTPEADKSAVTPSWRNRITLGLNGKRNSSTTHAILARMPLQPNCARRGPIVPAMTRSAEPVARRLFWRYRMNAQQAARDGNWKYLKINQNSFLFNVADDPLERANLKAREPEVFGRMEQGATGYDAEATVNAKTNKIIYTSMASGDLDPWEISTARARNRSHNPTATTAAPCFPATERRSPGAPTTRPRRKRNSYTPIFCAKT